MKKLFIYYSLTGNGDIIASFLKEKGFSIEKIKPVKDLDKKGKLLKIIIGGYQAMKNYKPILEDYDNDVSSYKEIYIGSPIWNDRLSSPINSLLDELDLTDKKITFIFYSGSGKNKKATEKVKELFPECKVIDIKEPKKVFKESFEKILDI